MHPEIRRKKPGDCPLCHMKLIPENTVVKKSGLETYRPLIVIIALILLTTLALALKDSRMGLFSLDRTMSYFMAGFFIVFSGFKLLDLKGFAQGYSTYDLLARRVHVYGYIYPFLELALGISYLLSFAPFETNVATVILMTFSGLGVLESLAKKRKFVCACLGTIIKVPLTTVTLVEDFGMVAMAALSILLMR